MIKVLYIVPSLMTRGSETYLLDLVSHLDKERFPATVWCEEECGPVGDELRKLGVTVVERPLRYYRPDQVLGAVRFIRRNRFDIVQSLKYGPDFMDALVCRLSRVKLFISSRRGVRHSPGPLKLHLGERLRNLITDHIIVSSEAVKDLTIVFEHVPATKISVIYGGVELDKVDAVLKRPSGLYRDALGIPAGAVVVGNLANLLEAKGQQYLVRAFGELVRRTTKDVYLVIQGEGPEEADLLALAKQLNLQGRVKVSTGAFERFEVLRSFDVYVSPSLNEGSSNSLLEAMAFSLPCIASDVGGNPEQVVHNVSGLIVPGRSVEPLAEAMLRRLVDPSLARQMGLKGRELVEKQYTVERMASAHARLYEELLGGD